MKTSKIILAAGLFALATAFASAGPSPEYWAQRRAERAPAAAATPTNVPKAGESCCRVVTVRRPIASHKVTMRVKAIECSGCAAMAAGEKCTTS